MAAATLGVCSAPSSLASIPITDFSFPSTSAPFSFRSNSFSRVRVSVCIGALRGSQTRMRSLLSRRSATRSVLEQGDEEAGITAEAESNTETNQIHNPSSNSFEAPPEWKEKQELKQAELAAKTGVSIRRRPPTGQPVHHVGPFEFRLQNEGNTPRNILEEIIWHKDTELSEMKDKLPLTTLNKRIPCSPPARDFIGALRSRASETGLPGLIAEVKKASPSRGVLQPDFDPVNIAKAYELGGAACLSVLTDSKYFQGSFENLELIREAGIQCPLLCKEFMVDAWQIYYARTKGADAILLIAAVLPDQDLRYMSKIAKSLGMATLVEVHDTREMNRVLGIPGIELIGINNRNLETFEVDINNTVALLQNETLKVVRERDILVIGESGLFTPADIALVQNAGVQAVLVGESLVRQKDPAAAIAGLFGKDISRRKPAQQLL